MWQWREVGRVHVSLWKVGDQAQRLIDAFRELYSRLLQTSRIDCGYPAQQEWIANRVFRSKYLGRTRAIVSFHRPLLILHPGEALVPALPGCSSGLPAIRSERQILHGMAILGATYTAFFNLWLRRRTSEVLT